MTTVNFFAFSISILTHPGAPPPAIDVVSGPGRRSSAVRHSVVSLRSPPVDSRQLFDPSAFGSMTGKPHGFRSCLASPCGGAFVKPRFMCSRSVRFCGDCQPPHVNAFGSRSVIGALKNGDVTARILGNLGHGARHLIPQKPPGNPPVGVRLPQRLDRGLARLDTCEKTETGRARSGHARKCAIPQ